MIDMVFPAAYGVLFAILLFRLFRSPFFLLPLAWLAAAFTLVKALFGYATLAAVCVGGVRWCGCGLAGADGPRRAVPWPEAAKDRPAFEATGFPCGSHRDRR